jgi:hypothetical protein
MFDDVVGKANPIAAGDIAMKTNPVTPNPQLDSLSRLGNARPATKRAADPSDAATNEGLTKSEDLRQLLAQLHALPDVRNDVVADAAHSVATGETLTPAAAFDTAQAISDAATPNR